MEYRVSAEGNSGINYRSSEVPGVPDALRGYQLDIDGQGEWTGQNYEERGRTFLALRGQVSCVETGKKPYVVGSTGDKAELFSQIDRDGWNECHVIAPGPYADPSGQRPCDECRRGRPTRRNVLPKD